MSDKAKVSVRQSWTIKGKDGFSDTFEEVSVELMVDNNTTAIAEGVADASEGIFQSKKARKSRREQKSTNGGKGYPASWG